MAIRDKDCRTAEKIGISPAQAAFFACFPAACAS